MIRRFRHRGLRRLFEYGDKSQVKADMLRKIENILTALDFATSPGDMDLPGFHLHQLKGDLRECWAVTVRGNWRIVWRFEDNDVIDVDLTDYH